MTGKSTWEPMEQVTAMNACPEIAIVDDDESVRDSLPDLIRAFGFTADAFGSAEEYLASPCVGETRCLVLDVAMPGMTGPELHKELLQRGHTTPVVFITANGGPKMRPLLIAQGAVDCLSKPFRDIDLLSAITSAIGTSRR